MDRTGQEGDLHRLRQVSTGDHDGPSPCGFVVPKRESINFVEKMTRGTENTGRKERDGKCGLGLTKKILSLD